jgi:CHAD domain-containing protein
MGKLTWDENASAAENARAQLPALAGVYFERGRELLAGETTPESLHAFRLRTKRLRYTLELFRPLYGPGIENYFKALRGLQRSLGDLHDCVSAREVIVEALPDPASPDRGRIERHLDARAAQCRAEFQNSWRKAFDAPGEEARWRRYLSRPAAIRPAPRR